MLYEVELFESGSYTPFKKLKFNAVDYATAEEVARSMVKTAEDFGKQNVAYELWDAEDEETKTKCDYIKDYGFGETMQEIGVEGPFSLEEASGRWKDYYGGWISPDDQVYFILFQRHISSIMAIHCDNGIPLPEQPQSYKSYCELGWTRIMSQFCSELRSEECREYGIGANTTDKNLFRSMRQIAVAFQNETQENRNLMANLTVYDTSGKHYGDPDYLGTQYKQERIADFSPTSMQSMIQKAAGVSEIYDAPEDFSVYTNPQSKLLSAMEEKYERPALGKIEDSEDSLFAYKIPKGAGGRPLTDIRFSKKTLERVWHYFDVGQDGLNWYEETPLRVAEAFNHDPERTRLFIGFLAATSPLRNIWRNTELALKALRQWDNCKVRKKNIAPTCEKDIASCFKLDMPNHESNAQRVVCGSPLSGPKVSAFYRNLTERPEEDSGVCTVDSWMMRAFDLRGPRAKEEDKEGAPTMGEYRAVEKKVQEMAKQAGVLPRQFQAAVWVGIKKLEGSPEDKADPFEKALFQQLEAAAAQEVFEFHEEEDIPEIAERRRAYRGVQARKAQELETYGPLTPELARDIGEPEHYEAAWNPSDSPFKNGVIIDMVP